MGKKARGKKRPRIGRGKYVMRRRTEQIGIAKMFKNEDGIEVVGVKFHGISRLVWIPRRQLIAITVGQHIAEETKIIGRAIIYKIFRSRTFAIGTNVAALAAAVVAEFEFYKWLLPF